MRLPSFQFLILLGCTLCATAGVSRAQISTDEANQRLREKLAAHRPASTQPMTEEERLRAENQRLRERLASLEEEVTTLKVILSHANPTTAPATRPAAAVATAEETGPQKALLGRWRGGDITNGSGYILTFNPDGSYMQMFIITGVKESGQYRILDDGTLEMWSDKTPEDHKHNQYHLAVTPLQATLTLANKDGIEVKNAQPFILKRAE